MATSQFGGFAEKLFEVGAAGGGAVSKKGAQAATSLFRELTGPSKEKSPDKNYTSLRGPRGEQVRKSHDQQEMTRIRQQLAGADDPTPPNNEQAARQAFSRYKGEEQSYRQVVRRRQEAKDRQDFQQRQHQKDQEQERQSARNYTPLRTGKNIGPGAANQQRKMSSRERKAAKSKG